MDTHVKVLAALQIAMGALGLLFAVILLVVFGGAASVVGASGDSEAQFAVPIIGITGMVLVAVLVVLSVPGIITGIGLFGLRPWARIAGIVLSILELTMIPFGTLVGVYGLWVLFSHDTERLFAAPPSVAPN
jgi:hypothetical protein